MGRMNNTRNRARRYKGKQAAATPPQAVKTWKFDMSALPNQPCPIAVENFWKWFMGREAFFSDHIADERTENTINHHLQKVNSDLFAYLYYTPWYNETLGSDTHAMSISAKDLKSNLATVVALMHRAPKLGRWMFRSFEGRKEFGGPDLGFEVEGVTLNLPDVRYSLIPDSRQEKIGIIVYMKGFTEESCETYHQLVTCYLESALGEYDPAMHIGTTEIVSFEDPRRLTESKPWDCLPQDFDEQLEKKIGPKPMMMGWIWLSGLQNVTRDGDPVTYADEKDRLAHSPNSVTSPSINLDTPSKDLPSPRELEEMFRFLGLKPGDTSKAAELGLEETYPLESSVMLTNFKHQKDLNGQMGYVVLLDHEKMRVGVKLTNTDRQVS
ncbi:MAG: hypothetical protein SGILL_007952, partial [Bacillariaceae sp.]